MLQTNTTLNTLYLVSEEIDASWARALALQLHHNSSLTHLCLKGSFIGELGVTSLATSLYHNSTLETLDLTDTAVTDSGKSALVSALQHNFTLTTLSLQKLYMDPSTPFELEIGLSMNRINCFKSLYQLLLRFIDEMDGQEECTVLKPLKRQKTTWIYSLVHDN